MKASLFLSLLQLDAVLDDDSERCALRRKMQCFLDGYKNLQVLNLYEGMNERVCVTLKWGDEPRAIKSTPLVDALDFDDPTLAVKCMNTTLEKQVLNHVGLPDKPAVCHHCRASELGRSFGQVTFGQVTFECGSRLHLPSGPIRSKACEEYEARGGYTTSGRDNGQYWQSVQDTRVRTPANFDAVEMKVMREMLRAKDMS